MTEIEAIENALAAASLLMLMVTFLYYVLTWDSNHPDWAEYGDGA